MESANLLGMYQEQTDIALFAKYRDDHGNIWVDEKEITGDDGCCEWNKVCCECGDKMYTPTDFGTWLCCGVLVLGVCTGEVAIC